MELKEQRYCQSTHGLTKGRKMTKMLKQMLKQIRWKVDLQVTRSWPSPTIFALINRNKKIAWYCSSPSDPGSSESEPNLVRHEGWEWALGNILRLENLQTSCSSCNRSSKQEQKVLFPNRKRRRWRHEREFTDKEMIPVDCHSSENEEGIEAEKELISWLASFRKVIYSRKWYSGGSITFPWNVAN